MKDIYQYRSGEFGNFDSKQQLELLDKARHRCIRLIREISGSSFSVHHKARNERRACLMPHVILKDGEISKRNTVLSCLNAKMPAQHNFHDEWLSDEYRFWDLYFANGKQYKHSTIKCPYGAITGIDIDGVQCDVKNIQEKTISSMLGMKLSTMLSAQLTKEIGHDITEIHYDIDKCADILKRLFTARTSKSKNLCEIYSKDCQSLKELEKKYTYTYIQQLEQIKTSVKDLLFKDQIECGWSYIRDAKNANLLNTCEVGCALCFDADPQTLSRLEESAKWVLAIVQERNGILLRERSPVKVYSPDANAFAILYISRILPNETPTINLLVERLLEYYKLANPKMDSLDDDISFNNYITFCQSIRALCNYIKTCSTEVRIDASCICKFQCDILTHWSSYVAQEKSANESYRLRDRIGSDIHRKFLHATALALIASTHIDSLSTRYGIPQNGSRQAMIDVLVGNPALALPRTFVLNREDDVEFVHWIEAWRLSALSMQNDVDKMLIIDNLHRFVRCHKHGQGTEIKHGTMLTHWASGHYYHAISRASALLSNYYE